MPIAYDALVLNAPLRQSLTAVRSLGRRGLRVAAAAAQGGGRVPTFASRWCRSAVTFPADDGSDAYLAPLDDWLSREGARVLIPSHDGTIALLRRHRAQLGGKVALALASEAALAVAVNKERTLAVARQLGLNVPREVMVRGAADLPGALREIGLPAVLKPNESWVGSAEAGMWVGPLIVTTPSEAAGAVDRLTRFGDPALYQQYLSGRREAVSFVYAGGEIYARFAQWAQRTYPPLGGASVLRQSIAVPADIGDGAERLVREIDLEGYCEVEFRRDGQGVPYLMEINPRLSASVEVAVRAGVDFPWLIYQWATGGPIDRVAGYRVGGWMRHLGGDIETTLAAIQDRGHDRPDLPPPPVAVWDFLRAFFGLTGYDYFQWSDARPAAVAVADFAGRFIKRLTSQTRRLVS